MIGFFSYLGAACSLASELPKDANSQQEFYGERSVEIVRLAAAHDEKRLSEIVSSEAAFMLGAGDVGRSTGSGVAGAVAFAELLDHDLAVGSYVYNGWDTLPGPTDPCGSVEVSVRFVSEDDSREATIIFEYHAGVLVSAAGWLRTRNVGTLNMGNY